MYIRDNKEIDIKPSSSDIVVFVCRLCDGGWDKRNHRMGKTIFATKTSTGVLTVADL